MILRIDEVNNTVYRYALLTNRTYIESQIKYSDLIDANVIEKLEQEHIDDKYILRWTALLESNMSQTGGFLRRQSGLIYTPNVFGKQGLVVFFTDRYGITEKYAEDLSTVWTTAYMWYTQIPYSKQDHIVVCTACPVTQVLFGLQDVVVPSLLWTDKYELPPLSINAINNGLSIIKREVTPLLDKINISR